MATTKMILSGSTDGRGVKITATSTPGTLIHTAHATDRDEIHIYAVNTSEFDEKITLEWGGTTSTDDLIELTVPSESGLQLVAEDLILTNSRVVRAFAEAADVIVLHGFVNRISA